MPPKVSRRSAAPTSRASRLRFQTESLPSRPMRIIRIGLDTAKHVFQVHGVDETETAVLRAQLRRGAVAKFFAKLPPSRIGLEAGGASHHWARRFGGLG